MREEIKRRLSVFLTSIVSSFGVYNIQFFQLLEQLQRLKQKQIQLLQTTVLEEKRTLKRLNKERKRYTIFFTSNSSISNNIL